MPYDIEYSKDNSGFDVSNGEDSVKRGKEGRIEVDEVADEISTNSPSDEEFEECRGGLGVLGGKSRKSRRDEGGEGGSKVWSIIEVNFETEEDGESFESGLTDVSKGCKSSFFSNLLVILLFLLIILFNLLCDNSFGLDIAFESFLSEMKEVEGRSKEIGPSRDEILSEMFKDIGKETQETELSFSRYRRSDRCESEGFSRRSDDQFSKRSEGEVDESS